MANQQVIDIARSWCGTPFRAGARVKGQGVDCIQLLVGIYEELYDTPFRFQLPAYNVFWADTNEVLNQGVSVFLENVGKKWEEAEPGDVMLFRMIPGHSAKHCGIKTGDDTMIEVLMQSYCIEQKITNRFYERRVVGAFRFPDKPVTRINN